MKTLYIDIYFLINFTVDVVSLYFAGLFSKIKCKNKRIILAAAIGAFASCLIIFIDYAFISILASVLSLLIMIFVCIGISISKRSVVFGISFLVFISLIGGFVSYFWEFLSKVFEGYVIENDRINRKVLFLAIIVLLSIGVFKMFITVMNTSNIDTKVDLSIQLQDKMCEAEALIDTGNLAIDPMSMRPVMIVKKELAKRLLPEEIIELSNVDGIDASMKKRIRLVPISRGGQTHVLVGIRPDNVKVKAKNSYEEIDVIIAIDKEGGDYGGFLALMPASAIKNANI